MMDFVLSLLNFQLDGDCIEQHLQEVCLGRAPEGCDLDRMRREVDRRGCHLNFLP